MTDKPKRLKIVMDISGNPYERTHVGCFAIPYHLVGKVCHEFKKKFPEYCRGKVKGSNLKEKDLLRIINFLDEYEDAYMAASSISNTDWKNLKKELEHKALFKEKILGITYYELLDPITHRKCSYDVSFCKDNFMDIHKAITTAQKLAKANNKHLHCSVSISHLEELLRFADFVASAQRKVSAQNIQKINKYRSHKCLINDRRIDKIFFKGERLKKMLKKKKKKRFSIKKLFRQ